MLGNPPAEPLACVAWFLIYAHSYGIYIHILAYKLLNKSNNYDEYYIKLGSVPKVFSKRKSDCLR